MYFFFCVVWLVGEECDFLVGLGWMDMSVDLMGGMFIYFVIGGFWLVFGGNVFGWMIDCD